MNDFNLAALLYRNRTDETRNCPYRYDFPIERAGNFRAPEEYNQLPLSEKADVYIFGNILFTILHGRQPYQYWKRSMAASYVAKGTRARMSRNILSSRDPAIMAIRNATDWCQNYDPDLRPTMPQVQSYLESILEILDPGRLDAWGRGDWREG